MAQPPQQSAILGNGFSPWQAPLAALFSGLSAAGQPGGWSNFGAGVAQGAQNFQQGQSQQQLMDLRQQQIQQQQEEMRVAGEDRARAEADRKRYAAMFVPVAGAPAGPDERTPGRAAILDGFDPQTSALLEQWGASDPQAAAQFILQQRLAQPKDNSTDDQREYKQAVEQGFKGTLEDWLVGQKKAGASSTTITLPGQESEYAKTFGKAEGDAAASIVPTADKSRMALDQLTALKRSLEQMKAAGADPGRYAPLLTELSAYAQGAGIDPKNLGLPANAGPAEQASAILNKLALANIGADQGGLPANNFTEADRKFITEIAGTIANTPEGLAGKIDLAERVHNRNLEAETLWNSGRYDQTTEAGYRQFKKDWAAYVKAHPLYSTEEMQATKGGTDTADEPTATGPDGKTYVPRNGQWVPK